MVKKSDYEDLILALPVEAMTTGEIAIRVGCDKSTVRYFLLRNNRVPLLGYPKRVCPYGPRALALAAWLKQRLSDYRPDANEALDHFSWSRSILTKVIQAGRISGVLPPDFRFNRADGAVSYDSDVVPFQASAAELEAAKRACPAFLRDMPATSRPISPNVVLLARKRRFKPGVKSWIAEAHNAAWLDLICEMGRTYPEITPPRGDERLAVMINPSSAYQFSGSSAGSPALHCCEG